MNLKKLYIGVLVCTLVPATASAQSNGGVNSSYSRFGLGLPADQSQGFNRSMGGVAQGLRSSNRINMLNPASYSAMDSLTFLFDVGMGVERTLMHQNGRRQAANSAAFDYVNAAFRVTRNLGMSVGFLPYTNIGYNFSQEKEITVDPISYQTITQLLNYEGSGGLHQAYMGVGWRPFKGLSIGANLGFLWGNIQNQTLQSFAENGSTNSTSYSSLSTYYSSAVRTWKGDIGIQFQRLLNSSNLLTVGATVSIGHKIHSEATMLRTSLNGDSINCSTKDAFQLPMTYSAGVAWERAQRLTVAADFTYEKWSTCITPKPIGDGVDIRYEATTGDYSDRWRINAGAEYVPGRYERALRKRINYRAGAYYSSPNLVINGQEGPKEFGITAGVGIPITNGWTRQYVLNAYAPSYVNIGVQWTRRDAGISTFIREDIFRINVGITFNERWFMKWKFR